MVFVERKMVLNNVGGKMGYQMNGDWGYLGALCVFVHIVRGRFWMDTCFGRGGCREFHLIISKSGLLVNV